jgi:hypothetical protein
LADYNLYTYNGLVWLWFDWLLDELKLAGEDEELFHEKQNQTVL